MLPGAGGCVVGWADVVGDAVVVGAGVGGAVVAGGAVGVIGLLPDEKKSSDKYYS